MTRYINASRPILKRNIHTRVRISSNELETLGELKLYGSSQDDTDINSQYLCNY